jgi:glycosyltransferase involved in cell wall biosynthesis
MQNILCEAFAFGAPAVAPRLGAFEDVVESRGVGRLFVPSDPENLYATISALWRDKVALERMNHLAHQEFEGRSTARRTSRRWRPITNVR